MTIQSPTARVSFPCNGVSNVFPVNIQAYFATDFLVLLTNAAGSTTLTLNSDYTLVTSGSLSPPFWSLTTQTGQLVSPYVTGNTLQVILNPAETQLSQYTQGQAFPSLSVQTNLDRLTQMAIRQSDILARAIVAPDGDVSPNMLLPSAALRASKNLGFDPSGNLAVNLALASGTISTATLAPFLNLSQTPAELAAGVTPFNFAYPPGNVLRYGANTVPGTTDMTAAFQAAFNQQKSGGAAVYIPTGQYLITSTVSVTSSPFYMFGDGMGKTVINKTGDSDCFVINNSGSAFNLITIRDLNVTTPIAMASGSAFNITGTGLLPSLTAQNVNITCGGSNNFAFGWKLNNCGETSFTRCFIDVASGAGQGWNLNASQAATTYKLVECSAYGLLFGAAIANTSNPGVEGIQFYGCDFVCAIGVAATNSQFPTYSPPQIAWIGGHMNCSQRNFDLVGYSQVTIQSALLYNSGNTGFIVLTNCSDVNISGNTFEVISASAPIAVGMSATQAINAGIVANNIFRSGAGGSLVSLSQPSLTNNLLITGNQTTGGAATMVPSAGTIQNTVVLESNSPRDVSDIFDATLTGAASMSLVGIRSDYCVIGAPGGATTCTVLTSRKAWDKVTLSCSSNLLTLQHNGAADGFVLAGATNYTFPAGGGRIHLERRNGTSWTEVTRD